jgi:hypothetical protein
MTLKFSFKKEKTVGYNMRKFKLNLNQIKLNQIKSNKKN